MFHSSYGDADDPLSAKEYITSNAPESACARALSAAGAVALALTCLVTTSLVLMRTVLSPHAHAFEPAAGWLIGFSQRLLMPFLSSLHAADSSAPREPLALVELVAVVLVLIASLWVVAVRCCGCRRVEHESLLVAPGIGLQLRTYFSANLDEPPTCPEPLVPWHAIKAVFINEGTRFTEIWT